MMAKVERVEKTGEPQGVEGPDTKVPKEGKQGVGAVTKADGSDTGGGGDPKLGIGASRKPQQ